MHDKVDVAKLRRNLKRPSPALALLTFPALLCLLLFCTLASPRLVPLATIDRINRPPALSLSVFHWKSLISLVSHCKEETTRCKDPLSPTLQCSLVSTIGRQSSSASKNLKGKSELGSSQLRLCAHSSIFSVGKYQLLHQRKTKYTKYI